MRALLLLLLAAPALSQEASLRPIPAEVAIGEPIIFELIVFCEHDTPIRSFDDSPLPDDSWVLLDGPTRAADDRGRFLQTTVRWKVMSLESGERSLPPMAVALSNGVTLISDNEPVLVRGELKEGEDAPRPPRDPHTDPPRPGPWWTLFVAPLGLLAVLAGAAWWTRRSVRFETLAAPDRISNRQRLAGFPPPEDVGDARRAAFALSGLVRATLDEANGVDQAGLDDGQWVESLGDGLLADPDQSAACRELLAALERVELGGHRPDRFGWEDLVHRARTLVDDVLGAEERELWEARP